MGYFHQMGGAKLKSWRINSTAEQKDFVNKWANQTKTNGKTPTPTEASIW